MGIGHCTSHQWLVPHIQFGGQQQQQLWTRSSDRSKSTSSATAAGVAARRGQIQDCLMGGRNANILAEPTWSSKSSSNSMYSGRRATATRVAAAGSAESVGCAAAAAMRAHVAAGIAPAAVAAEPELAASSGCNSDSTSSSNTGTSSNGSQLTDEAVLDRTQAVDALGRYSYRMVISYDGTAYSGWQVRCCMCGKHQQCVSNF